MPDKQKKINNPTVSSIQRGSKVSKSMGKSLNNKKDLVDKIEKIGNFVSNEIQKYNDDILGSNDILYLISEQLIAYKSENNFTRLAKF